MLITDKKEYKQPIKKIKDDLVKEIKIDSEDFKNKEGKQVRVSTIDVVLEKK